MESELQCEMSIKSIRETEARSLNELIIRLMKKLEATDVDPEWVVYELQRCFRKRMRNPTIARQLATALYEQHAQNKQLQKIQDPTSEAKSGDAEHSPEEDFLERVNVENQELRSKNSALEIQSCDNERLANRDATIIRKLVVALKASGNDNHRLRCLNAALETKFSELGARNRELEKDVIDRSEALKSLDNDKDQLKSQNTTLETENKELRERYNVLEKKINDQAEIDKI